MRNLVHFSVQNESTIFLRQIILRHLSYVVYFETCYRDKRLRFTFCSYVRSRNIRALDKHTFQYLGKGVSENLPRLTDSVC